MQRQGQRSLSLICSGKASRIFTEPCDPLGYYFPPPLWFRDKIGYGHQKWYFLTAGGEIVPSEPCRAGGVQQPCRPARCLLSPRPLPTHDRRPRVSVAPAAWAFVDGFNGLWLKRASLCAPRRWRTPFTPVQNWVLLPTGNTPAGTPRMNKASDASYLNKQVATIHLISLIIC